MWEPNADNNIQYLFMYFPSNKSKSIWYVQESGKT